MYIQTDPQKRWMMYRAFTLSYFRGYFSQKIYRKSAKVSQNWGCDPQHHGNASSALKAAQAVRRNARSYKKRNREQNRKCHARSHPHLDTFGSHAWKTDIQTKCGSTVKRSGEGTKEIQGTESLPSREQVGHFSWQGDVLQGDTTEVFKIQRFSERADKDSTFTVSSSTRTRGHKMKSIGDR